MTLINALSRIVINRVHPRYSKLLFRISSKYVDFCYGDNDPNRESNGEIYVLKTIAPHIKAVFDVGANTGFYSGYILGFNLSVKIHAFEPDARAYAELAERKVFKANNVAVGEKPGLVSFSFHKERTVFNSLLAVHSASDVAPAVQVPMVSVDSYARENGISHVDFLKVDVEGYEMFVMKGAEEMLAKGAIDMVQFEFSGGSVAARSFLKDFIDLFARHGYSLYRIKPDCIEAVRYRPDQERFTLTNYIAINNAFLKEHKAYGLHIAEPTFLP